MLTIQEQIQALLANPRKVGRLKYDDGKTINQALKQESKRLKQLIEKYIQQYYDSYYPVEYVRTGAMGRSVRVETNVDKLQIAIYFDDSAYHPSMFNSQYMRFVPTLMDSGWAWKNQNPSIYRFTFFEGDQFIKKAIDEFNQNNKYKFTIKVESTYNSTYYSTL